MENFAIFINHNMYLVLTVLVLLFVFSLIFHFRLGAFAAIVLFFVALGFILWGARLVLAAGVGGESGFRSDCEQKCPPGSSLVTCQIACNEGEGQPEFSVADQGDGQTGGGKEGVAAAPQVVIAPQVVAKETAPTKVLRTDALLIWFKQWCVTTQTEGVLECRPNGWIDGVTKAMSPEGTVAMVNCTERCDVFADNATQTWRIQVSYEDENVTPVVLIANGYFASDKRSFAGEWGKTVTMSGVGSWTACKKCWDIVAPPATETSPPVVVTTSYPFTFSATTLSLPQGRKNVCGCQDAAYFVECKTNGTPDWGNETSSVGVCKTP